MFRVMDGAGDEFPVSLWIRWRIVFSSPRADVPFLRTWKANSGIRASPVFHKKLEQNQKEAPVQIAGPLLPLQFTALEQGVRFKIDMSAGYSQEFFWTSATTAAG